MEKSSSKYTFDGVRPECVGGQFFNVLLNREFGILQLKKYYQTRYNSSKLCQEDPIKTVNVKLSDYLLKERMIGKPILIGCQSGTYIFQYITNSHKFIRFFSLNLNTGDVQPFEDNEHYFHKDMFSVGPLNCLISPNKQCALLRLPQSVLTCRKWSKLYMIKMDCCDNDITNFKGITNSDLRDRRFHTMTFDPCKGQVLVTGLVDEYCSRCKFLVYDLHLKKEVLSKIHRLGERSVTIHETESDSEEENETYSFLRQCSMVFSRDGDTVVLCCLVTDTRQIPFVKVFLYSSENLRSVGSCQEKLDDLVFPLLRSEIFSPILSACDSELHVWQLRRCHPPLRKVSKIELPRKLNLKILCRIVILQNIDLENIDLLPLPSSMINFLKFNQD